MSTTLPRQHYLGRNVCPNCRCRPLANGYKACEVCRDAMKRWMEANRARKDAYNKKRYEEMKASGLCPECAKPTEGNVYCRHCTTNRVRTRAFNRPRQSRNRWSKR